MSEKRCTLFKNSDPTDGKVVVIESNAPLNKLLEIASERLEIKAKRIFLNNGGEVDSAMSIRNDDVLYVSEGEPFKGSEKKGKKGGGRKQYRIAVIGPGGVGKSALTLRYVQGLFITEYDPTIEDAYRKQTVIDSEVCLLDILDTAGQEDYTALRGQWMRERQGFLLVYSLIDRRTFDDLQTFYDQLIQVHDSCPPLIVVGNKCDLEDNREVTDKEGQALARTFNDSPCIETSAKTGLNVEKIFKKLIREVRRRSPETTQKKPLFSCTML